MSSWSSSASSGAPVALTAEVQAGQTLFSSSSGYSVLEFIGEGCYGKVAKCQNLATNETVAVKILNKDSDTEKEVSMLEAISVLNPDHANVVKFYEWFDYMGQTCLALEMLDGSLYDLLVEREWNPLPPKEIRPIAKQLLVALDALKELRILHADIKPDNVMFVSRQDQPFRVKLIDFGKAIPASKVKPGMDLQPVGYRAPEIALGLPFTEAIDVWGVGCTLAFLYLAANLFPVECEYQMMKCMVKVLGQPEDHLLSVAVFSQYFFTEEEAANGPTWRLMTPEEFAAANSLKAEEQEFNLPNSLDDLVLMHPQGEAAEFQDRRAFVDMLKGLLHLCGDQRISPHQALQHPFITMTHLNEHPDNRDYLNTSQSTMSVCQAELSAGRTNDSAARRRDKQSLLFPVRGSPSASAEDAPATRFIDVNDITVSHDDEPTAGSSDGVTASCSNDEDLAAQSSAGANRTGWTAAAAVASSGRSRTLKRIHRFSTRIVASVRGCWYPAVGD